MFYRNINVIAHLSRAAAELDCDVPSPKASNLMLGLIQYSRC
jgi:hypothetical protein